MTTKQERRSARKQHEVKKQHTRDLLNLGWKYMMGIYGVNNPASRNEIEHAVHHMADSGTLPAARKYAPVMTDMQRVVFFEHYEEPRV